MSDSNDYAEVIYEVSDHIATVTLNRPERLNALTAVMMLELQDAMVRAGEDPDVGAVVLTGAGRGFCAGADMDMLKAVGGDSRASDGSETPLEPRAPSAEALEDFRRQNAYFPSIPKPVVCAVNGPSAGLGFVLTLYCDIRVASTTARMGTIFSRRGLVAEYGVGWLLPRMIGIANAADLLFSGRMIDPQEALRMGLVSRVVEADGLAASVRDQVLEMVNLASPRSIAVMKKQIYEGLLQPLGEHLDSAHGEMLESLKSQDFKEGVAHFLEKRPPKFTGK